MAKDKQTEAAAKPMVETMERTDLGPELNAVNGTRAPLAKVIPIEESRVDLFNPLKWTPADVETIKHTVCPKGIPDNEFKLFILKCQASGMNPLLGEAFCVERNIKVGGTRDQPIWGKAFVFTPGEQGMEGRADDFPDYRGLRAAVVCAKDKIVIDPSIGEVSHQYNPAEDRGRILGAWAIAYRDGRKTPVEFCKLEEYIDAKNPKWAGSPHTMIVKCARAAALRRAYPNKFDGIFVREELRDETAESQTPAEAEQANRDTTDRLTDRMKVTAQAQADLKRDDRGRAAPTVAPSKATVDVVAERPKTGVQLVEDRRTAVLGDVLGEEPEKPGVAAPPADPTKRDHATTEKLPHQQADEKKAEAVAQGPLMVFGPKKGKPIATLDGPEILEFIAFGESKIGTLDKEKAEKVRACINNLKAEERRRQDALVAASEPPEPGSDLDVD